MPAAARADEPERAAERGSGVAASGVSPGLCESPDGGSSACEPGPAYVSLAVARPSAPSGTVKRIGADEIKARGARNVPEALALEPSVEIQQSPKAGSALQMRGFDERAMLITLEGIPIREVYDGHFDLGALPVYSLDSISIERGVTSPLNGPNTAGGILSLRAPDKCDDTLDLSGFGGDLHGDRILTYGEKARNCVRFYHVNLHISGGYEHSDGYVLAHDYAPNSHNAQFHENGGIRDGSEYQRASMALLAKYAPSSNKSLSLFVDGISSPRGVPPFEAYGYTRYWKFKSYGSLLTGLSGEYGPEPDRLPPTWGFRQVRAHGYAHIHRDELRDYQDASYTRLTANPLAWFVASAYANETYGTEMRTSWSLNRGNQLDTALLYHIDLNRQREIPVPINGPTDWNPWEHYTAHSFTAAIEDTQVIGKWRLNAGLGADGMALLTEEIRNKSYPVNHRILPGFEGRLLAETILAKGLVLMAAGGHKLRYPTLKELFSNRVGGNTKLDTEQAWMTETGFDTRGLPHKSLESSVRLFLNSVHDLIESYRDSYANVGRAMTAGTEIELRYKPLEFLQFISGYRYLYARDVEHHRPLDYRTPHRLMLGARVVAATGLTGSIDWTYNSGQTAYYVDPANAGKWTKDRLPQFALLDAHVRYELGLGDVCHVYLFADAFNLLDRNYYAGSFEPRPGREVLMGIGGRV